MAVVVDGASGGPNAGPIASSTLAGAIRGLAGADSATSAVREAMRTVSETQMHGAATITVACFRAAPEAVLDLAWLGDSPAFLLRDTVLQQLTRPHNQAQELAESSSIDPEELASGPLADVLTRSVGAAGGDPEAISVSLRWGDRILLATDGIRALTIATIGWALSQGDDARAAADVLTDLIIDAVPEDNTTIAVLVVGGLRASACGVLSVPEIDADLPIDRDVVPSDLEPLWPLGESQPTVAAAARRRWSLRRNGRTDDRGRDANDTTPLPDL